jgi:tape measure domain-containing protein
MGMGIQSAVSLYDGMTPALRNITNSLNMVITSFETLHQSSSEPFDLPGLQRAREQLNQAEASFTEIEESVRRSDNSQQRFNSSIRNGNTAANGLSHTISRIAMTAATAFSIGKGIELSDSFSQASSRLDLMNDGLQTTAQLQDMIYQSAQSSKGSYLDNLATVSKLGLLAGDSFASNAEMVDFVELMNKNFVIGGASSTEQTSAMYQLTQAMASGRLQGDEYRSIIENAPMLASAIEDYMKNANVEGTMKDWASEGLLTSEVIKNALFSSAGEIEARFDRMPMTFGQIWTTVKNSALMEFQPILTRLNEIANSDRFKNFVNVVIDAISNLADVALSAFEVIIDVGTYVHDNWDDIGPIVYGIVAAYIAWEVATKAVAIAHAFMNPVAGVIGVIAAAVGVATFAYAEWGSEAESLAEIQDDFNQKLSVQPAYVAAEKVKSLMTRYEELEKKVSKNQEEHDTMNNIISELERTIPGLSEQIRTETGYIDNLSVALRTATDQFYKLAKAQAYYNAYSDKLEEAVNRKIESEDMYTASQQVLENAQRYYMNDGGENGSNANTHQKVIASNQQNVADRAKALEDADAEIDKYLNLMNEYREDMIDYNELYGSKDNYSYSKIADNTEEIKSALQNDLVEDIKYLKDYAERESINRFTTAEVNVNLGGVNNTVSSDRDLDGIVEYVTVALSEQLSTVAETYNGEV